MKTALQLCFGLLLAVNAVGCHTCQNSCQPTCDTGCGHRSCLHKVFDRFRGGGGCGCQTACDGGCEEEATCACGRHHHRKKCKHRCDVPSEAAMHGYNKSVVYTGDDWQGIPQPAMGMMPMAGGCSGCAGGAPMMMPSGGCSGCGGTGLSPIPAEGGCASCGGTGSAPAPAPTGCASCGGNHPTPAAAPSGGCASCGAGAMTDSFYNPMGPNHSPAPAPPAEGSPAPGLESVPGGDKAATSGDSIQKIHWMPRQL